MADPKPGLPNANFGKCQEPLRLRVKVLKDTPFAQKALIFARIWNRD